MHHAPEKTRFVFRSLLVALLLHSPAFAATKLLVTVVEQKSGRPVMDLKTGDFTVWDDRTPRPVESCELSHGLMDVMLLLDTSLVGGHVRPLAEDLIRQLQPKDQMSIATFASTADLIQDFTSSQELLRKAVAQVKYGNVPQVLDGLYAAIGGFENSSFRRAILLVTTGWEGPSQVSEREVAALARRNGVSIYPVYVTGEGPMFERLARQTGGASFNLRDIQKAAGGQYAQRIFEVLRSYYTLTLKGDLSLGEKTRVEAAHPTKLAISALPLE
jgi:VWFA-related protein